MSGIDYSKWDHLEVSESDKTDSDKDGIAVQEQKEKKKASRKKGKPQIISFKKSRKVTIGKNGISIHEEQKDDHDESCENSEFSETTSKSGVCSLSPKQEKKLFGKKMSASIATESSFPSRFEEIDMDNTDDVRNEKTDLKAAPSSASPSKFMTKYVLNGGIYKNHYFWNQDLYNVEMYLRLPDSCKGSELSVHLTEMELKCTYKKGMKHRTDNRSNEPVDVVRIDHNNENSSDKEGLSVKDVDCSADDGDIWTLRFPYPVQEDSDTWLWEVVRIPIDWEALEKISTQVNNQIAAESSHNCSNKIYEKEFEKLTLYGRETTLSDNLYAFLHLQLKKKKLFADIFVWWSSIAENYPRIDVKRIPGRINKFRNSASSSIGKMKDNDKFCDSSKVDKLEETDESKNDNESKTSTEIENKDSNEHMNATNEDDHENKRTNQHTFLESWKKAHTEFREIISKRQPIYIDPS